MTGPYPSGYGIRTEVEDLQAVLAESGAEMFFRVSACGLVALEAARRLPAIRSVAVYEPALLMDASRHTGWISRFDQEMAQGNVAAAMVTSMYGLELAPPVFKVMPRRLLESLTRLAMKSEDKKAASDTVTMRRLAPTVRYEGVLLTEMAGTIATFAEAPADVLILGGTKGLPFLKPALDALAHTLPHNQRVEFPGLDHGGSSDASGTNPGGGKPESSPRRSAPSSHSNSRQPAPVPARRQLAGRGRHDELSYVPTMRTQLIAARPMGRALADLTSPQPGHQAERPPAHSPRTQ